MTGCGIKPSCKLMKSARHCYQQIPLLILVSATRKTRQQFLWCERIHIHWKYRWQTLLLKNETRQHLWQSSASIKNCDAHEEQRLLCIPLHTQTSSHQGTLQEYHIYTSLWKEGKNNWVLKGKSMWNEHPLNNPYMEITRSKHFAQPLITTQRSILFFSRNGIKRKGNNIAKIVGIVLDSW